MLKKTLISLILFFLMMPVSSAVAGNVITIVRGGVGAHIVVHNLTDHNVTINFTINWTDLSGEKVDSDGFIVEIVKRTTFEYGSIPIHPFIQRVSIYLETEDKIIAKKGFSFFGFVFLHRKIF